MPLELKSGSIGSFSMRWLRERRYNFAWLGTDRELQLALLNAVDGIA
jgi:hypothetical protein